MSDHVRFLIRGCLRHLACLEEEVEELDAEILRRMQLSTFQKAFRLLQTIPGVGQLSAATILAETGPDLESFPTIVPVGWYRPPVGRGPRLGTQTASERGIHRIPATGRRPLPGRRPHPYRARQSFRTHLPRNPRFPGDAAQPV